ncbi:MAG: gamma-glutamyltransferase [Desulfobacterales bacterium]|nr:MAG: gamma-glutamyltransferase [Desulfobacterales bacterium]
MLLNFIRTLNRQKGIIVAGVIAAMIFIPSTTLGFSSKTLGVPGVRGGVVTTSEPVAAQVGAEILKQGGNAVDAAAAVAFALNVLEPQSSGIGGGGFMMIHMKKKNQTFVIDSRETAPAAATPDMFLQTSGSPFAFATRSTSGIAVGVPGMLRGIELALKQWGTITLADALSPAIDLAENGIRVSSRLAQSIPSSRLSNEPGDPAYDEARNVFRPGGFPLEEGQLLIQPDLAYTFKILAEEGADAFYGGDIAEAIVETQLNTRSQSDPANQAKLVGRMTLSDLENYQAAIRKPVADDYRGYRIVSMPPPSSGGLTVIQILKLIERFPIGDKSAGFGFGQTRTLNVMIEAMRLAFADRAIWMGDDDFVDVPSTGLLNDKYIAMRSALIDPDGRQSLVEAGDPRPYDNPRHKKRGRLSHGPWFDEEGLNTTHFSIVDRYGNIVTYTNTIESAWGTGLMVPGYGFMLNNELTDFNSIPTYNPDPDNFNPGANDAAPGKRPRSSMSPTIIFRNNKPLVAYGSPGGSTIINTVVNIGLNLIDHDKVIQEAVDAPRISQTSTTGSASYESGFSDMVLKELRDLGHTLSGPAEIGSVQAVVIDQRDKRFYGAADKRRIGGIVSVRSGEIVDW